MVEHTQGEQITSQIEKQTVAQGQSKASVIHSGKGYLRIPVSLLWSQWRKNSHKASPLKGPVTVICEPLEGNFKTICKPYTDYMMGGADSCLPCNARKWWRLRHTTILYVLGNSAYMCICVGMYVSTWICVGTYGRKSEVNLGYPSSDIAHLLFFLSF